MMLNSDPIDFRYVKDIDKLDDKQLKDKVYFVVMDILFEILIIIGVITV